MINRLTSRRLSEDEKRGLMERGVVGSKNNRIWVDLAPADIAKYGLRRIEWQR